MHNRPTSHPSLPPDTPPPATGRVRRHVRTDRFRFTEVEQAGVDPLPTHAHARPALNFVISGRYLERIGRHSFEAQAGHMIYKPAGMDHANAFEGRSVRSLIIEFDPAIDDGSTGDVRSAWHRFDPALTRAAMRILVALTGPEAPDRLLLDSVATELVAASTTATPPRGLSRRSKWLDVVADRLHEEYAAPPGLSELAATADVCVTHLARAFRRHFGSTPGEYARMRRLSAAMEDIVTTHKPFAAIAAAAGFADQSHLVRSVRNATGRTPLALRKAAHQR